MFENGSLIPSLEKGVISSFRQTNVTYRQGQIGSRLIDTDNLQLPTNSVLHLCDQYRNTEITTIYPDFQNPLLVNEQFKKYLDFIVQIPSKDAKEFPVTDKQYRYRPFNYNTEIRHFYTEHRDFLRLTTRSILTQPNLLPIFDYNVICSIIVTGQFAYYRKFDILFRSILSNIVSIEGRHQFLQIELSDVIYNKSQFQQSFDKINYQTIRIKNDPSFYFLVHLINFLSKDATTSLFSQLTQIQLDQLNLILTANDKAIIYNLGDLKAMLDARQDNNLYQMVIRHITALKFAGYHQKDITNLSETETDTLIDQHVVDEHNEGLPEKTSDISIPSHNITRDSDNNLISKLESSTLSESQISPVKTIKTTGADISSIPIHTLPKLEKEIIKPPVDSEEKSTKISDLSIPIIVDQNRFTTVIDHAAQKLILQHPHLTDAQKSRVLKIAQTYKSLTLDGIALEELLDQLPEPKITDGRLEFLKDKLVDQSMLDSTAIDLDRHYVQHMMTKDIAAVAAQMASHGMFLTAIEQKEELTQLDRIKSYKFTYEDIDGRKHKIAFKLPIVSHDGTVMINGITSRMIKQQVNLPICKIDANRVSLASNFNKTIVERIATKAHSYDAWIIKYINTVYKEKIGLELGYGNLHTDKKLPYDYSCIANRYSRLQFSFFDMNFDFVRRFGDEGPEKTIRLTGTQTRKIDLRIYEKKYGVLVGHQTVRQVAPVYLFFGYDNRIRSVNTMNDEVDMLGTFTDIFFNAFADKVDPPKQLSEWTELKILDKNFPIVFILGFEFGLQKVLDYIHLNYKFYPPGSKFERSYTTILVPFNDGTLVFDRYPLEASFIASGLLKFDTKSFDFDKFNSADAYYTLLEMNNYSMNYLKGISDFFKLFIDPITRDVLLKMHEPTDVAGLLLRATQMLTTEEHIPASSMANHRLRGYERFSSILYNEMARTYASYANQRGNKKIFSINPEAVFLRIIQDQTLQIVDEINPIENIKDKHALTYAGMGGRTAQSFVVEDRQYPDDAVGILSNCTPDSGKVALNSYTTVNPVIQNIRGMFNTNQDIEKLEPSQVLSATSLLMPCSTNED